ncbi:S8 family serine peptidase [Kribbella sp. NBC_01505]|uniref:S8 family serine peptidase n=1 Tax=Kribbella sp. NBC_01505 TaxID=2903580 RepID=UPI003866D62A
MRLTRSLVALLGAASLITGAAVAATAGTDRPDRDTASTAAALAAGWTTGGTHRQLTLITGDRVDIEQRKGAPDRVTFRPGPEHRSSGATISQAGGHTYVVPSVARPQLAAGQLDRSLFDVTTLLAELGDDSRSTSIPVIVEYAGQPGEAAARAEQALPGSDAGTILASIGGRAATVHRDRAGAFWSSIGAPSNQRSNQRGTHLRAAAIRKVWLDRKVTAALDWSVPQIGVPAARKRGLSGKGIKVAVLDTGIDATHPDLKGRVAAAKNFTSTADVTDHAGHGTHVAGTIAGTGAASNGKYVGVAPDATLLNGKVLDDEGSGTDSSIIAGAEWAVAQGAKVVNISIGSSQASDGTDPMSRAIDKLTTSSGALFVVSAGNCDFKDFIGAPGSAAQALTVANLQRSGAVNETSCQGPRNDRATKPDIAAPGTDIVAPRAAGSDIGDPVGKYYTTLTGTSMAAPHVAGSAVLLAQQHQDWKAAQLKARLISTADPMPKTSLDAAGAGRVDADQATDNSVGVDTAELEFGTILWPHPAPKPVSRIVTYQNPGKAPVTLSLTAPLDADDNGTAPKLSASQLVVPAGGKASVTVTADPGTDKLGRHTGRVIAKPATGDPLVTTYGWFLEPEMYDVTVHGVLPDGSPADSWLFVTRPDGGPVDTFDGQGGPEMIDGVATMRIVPGVYSISATFWQPATATRPETYTIAAQPQISIKKTTEFTLDARKAVPVGVSLAGKHGLSAGTTSMAYFRKDTAGKVAGFEEVAVDDAPAQLFAVPTSGVTVGKMEFSAGTRLETPAYRLWAGKKELKALELVDGPRFAGTRQLEAVAAGTGQDAELKVAAGKLAVVAFDPDMAPADVALAAQRAKVAGVLFYDPLAPGLGTDRPSLGDPALKIPVLMTSRESAADLPKKTVRIDGVTTSPVVYDLLKAWPGRIPVRPTYQYRAAQLARTQESYAAHTATTQLWETRLGYTPLGEVHGTSPRTLSTGPVNRVGFVSPGEWDQRVVTGTSDHVAYSSAHRYRVGERQRIAWGGPVVTSGLPAKPPNWPTETGVVRTGDHLVIGLAAFQQGSAHYEEPGFAPEDTYALALERDGKTLVKAEELVINGPVPVAPGNYRLTLDAQRTAPWWKYSTKVSSIWDFRSRAGKSEVMPMILADVGLPKADDLNRVPIGTPTPITLALRHQTGAPQAAISKVSLRMSYDGRTWIAVPLKKTSANTYQALVTHQQGGTIDLALDITDAAGGRLQQHITKAYGLK